MEILTCPAGRQIFLETAGGELMSHVNKVNLIPGHCELGAPPSLPCCPHLIQSSGRPACASTSCCHAAIFNLGCWLHPQTKLDLPCVRVKVTADSGWSQGEPCCVGCCWSHTRSGSLEEFLQAIQTNLAGWAKIWGDPKLCFSQKLSGNLSDLAIFVFNHTRWAV